MEPQIILNFKTYERGTGKKALVLAKICDVIAKEHGVKIIVCPQISDIRLISDSCEIPVYSQHVDPIKYGSNTGHILPEAILEAGAKGCLLNHSENRIKLADMEASLEKLKELGLASIICTNNINTTRSAAALGPDFVAIEPPELIGSGIPVSKSQPEIITGSVEAVNRINPEVGTLCGAGISKGEDLKAALDLGTIGVLLASGVVCAKDQEGALMNLIEPLL